MLHPYLYLLQFPCQFSPEAPTIFLPYTAEIVLGRPNQPELHSFVPERSYLGMEGGTDVEYKDIFPFMHIMVISTMESLPHSHQSPGRKERVSLAEYELRNGTKHSVTPPFLLRKGTRAVAGHSFY